MLRTNRKLWIIVLKKFGKFNKRERGGGGGGRLFGTREYVFCL